MAEPSADAPSRWSAADLLIAVALVAAFVKRLPSLPYNGMFHDDSWQAPSITLTTPRQWLRTSIDHPLFVALLSPLRWFAHTNPVALVVPVLIVGALAPAAVFVMLRSLRYSRSIATSLAAVLVVAPGPVRVLRTPEDLRRGPRDRCGHRDGPPEAHVDAVDRTWGSALVLRCRARRNVHVFVLVAIVLAGVVLVIAAEPIDGRRRSPSDRSSSCSCSTAATSVRRTASRDCSASGARGTPS